MASDKIKKAISLMVFEGLNQNEATSEANITPQYFSSWKKKNGSEYEELRVKYERQFLGDLSAAAIRTYEDILRTGRSEHVKYLVSQDILDRAGHKQVDKQDINLSGGVVFMDDVPSDDNG